MMKIYLKDRPLQAVIWVIWVSVHCKVIFSFLQYCCDSTKCHAPVNSE